MDELLLVLFSVQNDSMLFEKFQNFKICRTSPRSDGALPADLLQTPFTGKTHATRILM